MADDLDKIPSEQRREMLSIMLHSPAFVLFCQHWDEKVLGTVEAKIFDPATPPAETHELKLVRERLIRTYKPHAIVETMMRSAHSETNAQKK